MGAQTQAEVVPEGFLEEEARLRHLHFNFSPSQGQIPVASLVCPGGLLFVCFLRPSLAVISHSNSHPACSQN